MTVTEQVHLYEHQQDDSGQWWICGRRHGSGRYRRISGPYASEAEVRHLGFLSVDAFMRSAAANKGPTLWWMLTTHRHPVSDDRHPRLAWSPRRPRNP